MTFGWTSFVLEKYDQNPGINPIFVPINGMVMIGDWINIHTHKPGQGISIADPCLGAIQLPAEGVVYYSSGIHPLYINDGGKEKLTEIEQAAAAGRIVAIGEAGLDRNSPVGMEIQMELFRRQAEIAARNNLPLIVHGVRAIPEIITVYNKCRAGQNWIMHGFNNRKEVLQDLLCHNFYISAGRHVMNRESKIYQLLPEIPEDRLFIETDNSDFSIQEIYQRVAERREIAVEKLQQVVRSNFERLFQI